ncbi:tRNA preQ1(34) S-adenosylmethionine ribosyltransferase-isomerase QueA [Alicyclobacillus ferrooxydans]|uniref:S-adenosylmethionine:tRNA ribosyltransferase-isomerase n=1 Tax=Alicyclobacillus ferrooxydans TaxID=471514 RepID=A0A0P9EHU2_9BACL|nr:tRNA preQ1(34) S-adenosylmethionine ribosyltransferase-isomerase QueA [Alicyclobacillus ferrooxydans]KPV42272.1 S-adenosylmethionine tRNA ribosyltransferase [Alicyclobacillus ferrooxydans]
MYQRKTSDLRVEDFDYALPDELIAQHPLEDRDASRLMVLDPVVETIEHRTFRDIVRYLNAGDVLVFNNSKVLPARLYGKKEDTGANVELLLTKRLGPYEWEAMAKPAKRLREGHVVIFPSNHGLEGSGTDVLGQAVVAGVEEDGIRRLRFTLSGSMEEFLYEIGQMPLPPYIHEPLREADRYQTVYAKDEGSVAAPTAGLHFTESLLDSLREKGVDLQFVTLHVGIGTFRPVTVDRVEDHHMHSETYYVDPTVADAVNRAKREGRRVIAVGTTALRTLESAGQSGEVHPGHGDTDIFIYPGYQFQVIDALITNFHLPKSTLIMLVSALMGTEFTKRVYEAAVRERYRFFSFGDAMFITRKGQSE